MAQAAEKQAPVPNIVSIRFHRPQPQPGTATLMEQAKCQGSNSPRYFCEADYRTRTLRLTPYKIVTHEKRILDESKGSVVVPFEQASWIEA